MKELLADQPVRILAGRIKALRTSLGFNQSQFSRVSKIHRNAIVKLEQGAKPLIRIDDLFKMIDLGLDVTPAPVNDINGNVNRDKELGFFESCLSEDSKLLSSFYSWLIMNKGYIETTCVGIV